MASLVRNKIRLAVRLQSLRGAQRCGNPAHGGNKNTVPPSAMAFRWMASRHATLAAQDFVCDDGENNARVMPVLGVQFAELKILANQDGICPIFAKT